jgi:hypothetical protein
MFDDDAADIALVDQLLNAPGKLGAADSFLRCHDIASSSIAAAHPPTAWRQHEPAATGVILA